MAIEMNDINQIVSDTFMDEGIENPTIDQRIEVLSGLAKNIAAMTDLDPLENVRIPLMITVEIVRLRTEKQMFGLD